MRAILQSSATMHLRKPAKPKLKIDANSISAKHSPFARQMRLNWLTWKHANSCFPLACIKARLFRTCLVTWLSANSRAQLDLLRNKSKQTRKTNTVRRTTARFCLPKLFVCILCCLKIPLFSPAILAWPEQGSFWLIARCLLVLFEGLLKTLCALSTQTELRSASKDACCRFLNQFWLCATRLIKIIHCFGCVFRVSRALSTLQALCVCLCGRKLFFFWRNSKLETLNSTFNIRLLTFDQSKANFHQLTIESINQLSSKLCALLIAALAELRCWKVARALCV